MTPTRLDEQVVLLDASGRSIGTAPKARVHDGDTPLHLGFSAYVFDDDGRLLVTRRALDKATFPGVYTNTVCGHPAPGEGLVDAVARRARVELALEVSGIRLVLPDFAYRAEMHGVVEHELCPVLVAHVGPGTAPALDPEEVDDAEWVPWSRFAHDVVSGDRTVSQWCTEQVPALVALGDDPRAWPAADPSRLPRACQL